MRSEGALPAGRVWAENSGTASLPNLIPGACYSIIRYSAEVDQHNYYEERTPFVVNGWLGGTRAWNSP